jgi:hypothetical protein
MHCRFMERRICSRSLLKSGGCFILLISSQNGEHLWCYIALRLRKRDSVGETKERTRGEGTRGEGTRGEGKSGIRLQTRQGLPKLLTQYITFKGTSVSAFSVEAEVLP